jgi:putative hemolysin
LYSLAVYIDPEEVNTLVSGASRRRQRFLRRLVDDPRAFIQIGAIYKSFALIVQTLIAVNLMISSPLLQQINRPVLIPVGLLVLWVLTIIIVEFLPRRTSRTAINPGMLKYLWILVLIYGFIYPVLVIYRKALSKTRSVSIVREEDKEEIVERAIESLADQAGISETIIEEDEKEMIGHIFQLDQTVVREIMTPRIDVTAIEKSMSFREIRGLVLKDGHSRFPVYQESIDKLIGILYVKDLFSNMPEAGEEFVIRNYLRKPYFIPESKNIGELLKEFKAKKLHIAIVIDEYGGTAGLVTLEDILEEIVGEIQDEHDTEEAEITKLDEHSYLVDPNLMVEKLQEELDTEYKQTDNDTVGGLIYDLVGSVPHEGKKVRWHDIEFKIVRVEGQRIMRVKVRRHPIS